MTKTRLEAFSDGVFSIAITLLVLDIRLPQKEAETDKGLLALLSHTFPSIAIFIFSFLVIGVFWVAHHRIFAFIRYVDHYIMWSNIFYLLTVAVIPFPASVLGRYPFYTTAIIFYSSVLLFCGLQHFLLLRYVFYRPALREPIFTKEGYKQSLRVAAVGPCCYAAAIGSSFLHPGISFGFILLALAFYIFIVPRFLPQAAKDNATAKAKL